MTDNFAVLDIETKESFLAVGGYNPTKLSVSVAGLYTAIDDQFRCFAEDELSDLWSMLEQSSRVIGFNLDGFDYPVLQKYYSGNILKLPTLDILTEFKIAQGFRIKLDALARETLGIGKSGDGLQAIRLYEQGRLSELKKYCLDDVKITRDLFLQGRDKGVLYYQDQGKRTTWMVDWTPRVAVTSLTLPF